MTECKGTENVWRLQLQQVKRYQQQQNVGNVTATITAR